jgi:hypothetical protein
MPASQPANFNLQEFTDVGQLLVGGRLYTYGYGTTAQKTAYTDPDGTVPHTYTADGAGGQYIALNARGELPAPLYLGAGSYDLSLKRADGSTVWTRKADGVDNSINGALADFAAAGGADKIGVQGEEAGSILQSVADRYRERVSVFQFMTEAQIADVKARTFLTDATSAMQKLRDAIAGSGKKGVFPGGGYKYSQSPNWGILHAQIEFEGMVTLRYTGAGDAVIFDADGAGAVTNVAGEVYGVKFGWGIRPAIEVPPTAGNAVFCRNTHHCKIGARVRGAGAASAGLLTKFAVCSEFDVEVSGNVDGWYMNAKPAMGYNLDKRNAGQTTSYCTFVNPIGEGPTIGCQLTATLGNIFIGGAFEACSQYGVYASPGAAQDKFIGTDFEVNTLADVYDMGTGLILDHCDTYSQLTLGTQSKNATVRGGRHSKILSDTGSLRATLRDLVFNRFNDGSTLVDAGTGTLIDNCRNGGTNTTYLTGIQAVNAVTVANNALGVTAITVTGAKLGDFALVAFDAGGLGAMMVWGQVTAAGVVTAYNYNNTGAGVNVPAGNWRATVLRR